MFGWDYPPGAERDPFAPWNQRELDEEPDDTEPDDEESEAE